ncbi:uncharacterized protein [Euphorbia lathyris]|uniref:uncharacterized protein n=1 Tax=Euphorbia lathyris TaxID=212925 RepID=UPI0033139B57
MDKRKHRRSKSSPGFINGWRGSGSFDSVIDESPKPDEHGFSWAGIRINENLKKKDEAESPEIINHGIHMISKSSPELSELGVSVNGNEEGENYYPIFNSSNYSSSSLPPNWFSHSSSSCNSSISLRIPSSNVSSASNSLTTITSNPYGNVDHKNSISGENSGGLENGFELTFPVSDFGQRQQQGSFMGRMMSLIQSPPAVQSMERSVEGYDPHRIPSAVFESNRTVEWSVASNESLFSLNLGRTNSLSPEKLFGLGDFNTGELDPLAVYRFTGPRTSDSDHSCYRISDVEIDLLKKIEEDGAEDSEQRNSEENVIENSDLERTIEVSNEVADDTNNKLQLDSKQQPDLALSFRVEEPTDKIPPAKITKNSEESVKSTSSFAFQVLEDEKTKAKDPKDSSSIQNETQQPLPDPDPKASWKSWFDCLGCCSCFSILCCNYKSCCGGSSCPCNCSSYLPSSCTCKCNCSWCRCFSCGGASFCCFGTQRLYN